MTVQLLKEGDFGSPREAALAGWTDNGWYFWDETRSHCYGPHPRKKEAERYLKIYAEGLLNCQFCQTTTSLSNNMCVRCHTVHSLISSMPVCVLNKIVKSARSAPHYVKPEDRS